MSISVKQLSKQLPWSYSIIQTKTCMQQLAGLIEEFPMRRMIKIENVPKVTQLLYEVMGK